MKAFSARVKKIYLNKNNHSNSVPESSQPRLLRNIKGIIFDFDGTLFDNAFIALNLIFAYPPDLFRIWRERLVCKRFIGCDYFSAEDYYRAFFNAFARACKRTPEQVRSWYFDRFMPRMINVLKKHYKCRPGVQELFRNFENSNNIRIAVYSDYPLLRERLVALDVYTNSRILLYGLDCFGAQKPCERPFLQIARDLGVKPEEVLVIGDRKETDGFGAFNAGMRFFYLETGRKRYFRLDPYRRREKEALRGPSLVMYAGFWDDLAKLLATIK